MTPVYHEPSATNITSSWIHNCESELNSDRGIYSVATSFKNFDSSLCGQRMSTYNHSVRAVDSLDDIVTVVFGFSARVY